MKRARLAFAGVLFAGVLSVVPLGPGSAASSSATTAAAPTLDLATTGAVVGGEVSTESDHLLAFSFAVRNDSPRTYNGSVDLHVTAIRHATFADTMCVLPSNHFGINGDGPNYCEMSGPLRSGRRDFVTVILQPDAGAPTPNYVSIRACAGNEAGISDPVPGNNCQTLRVEIR